MDKFFLEIPTLKRKTEALEYLQEHIKFGSNLNGTGGMDKCLKSLSYEEWLNELEKRKDVVYLKKINRCESKTFFLIRESDNKIVGMVNVRYNIPPELIKNDVSHIGYGIRPSERRKGYAKLLLYLALLEEAKVGENKILVDCDVDNIASNKTILALGGKLERTGDYLLDDCVTNFYTIDAANAIKTYANTYKNAILSNKIQK